MEVCIKDTLRSLRQKKNVTQRALANHLGITAQSVGKWERGEGFPEISLLPGIAMYFNVTIDELLNVDRVRMDEKIKEYQDQSRNYRESGESEKNLVLWEMAYTEFPDDCRVMSGLLDAIVLNGGGSCSREDAGRIISLGERILDSSRDTRIRENALRHICSAYGSIGNAKSALRYASQGGSISATQEALRASVLSGEDGVAACRAYIAVLLEEAAAAASELAEKAGSDSGEAAAARRFAENLPKISL